MIQDGSMDRLFLNHQYISTSFRIYLGPFLSLWYFKKSSFWHVLALTLSVSQNQFDSST